MTSTPIKLLLDEHIWEGLAGALRDRGYDVVHISHTKYRSADDESLLVLSSAEGRSVLTYNHRDFVPLVRFWYEDGREHAGLILSIQLRRGELLRQVERLLISLTVAEARNTVRWLQEFK